MDAAVAVLAVAMSDARRGGATITATAEQLVLRLYHDEARSLVRLASLFVDDRDAAEDLVQEAFIRLARSAHRVKDGAKAPAYLRSIVLNLARDHNRRGLMSLRHQLPEGREVDVDLASVESAIVADERHQAVLAAVRTLPLRQRDCVVLRYFEELGIAAIAETLSLSPNSVKTHLRRGLDALELNLANLVQGS